MPQLKLSIFKFQIQNSKVLGASGATHRIIIVMKVIIIIIIIIIIILLILIINYTNYNYNANYNYTNCSHSSDMLCGSTNNVSCVSAWATHSLPSRAPVYCGCPAGTHRCVTMSRVTS